MTGVEKGYSLAVEAWFGTREEISANLLTGEANGVHLPRDIDRVSEVQLSDKNGSGFSLVENNKKQYAYEVKRNLIGVFTFLNTIETLWFHGGIIRAENFC